MMKILAPAIEAGKDRARERGEAGGTPSPSWGALDEPLRAAIMTAEKQSGPPLVMERRAMYGTEVPMPNGKQDNTLEGARPFLAECPACHCVQPAHNGYCDACRGGGPRHHPTKLVPLSCPRCGSGLRRGQDGNPECVKCGIIQVASLHSPDPADNLPSEERARYLADPDGYGRELLLAMREKEFAGILAAGMQEVACHHPGWTTLSEHRRALARDALHEDLCREEGRREQAREDRSKETMLRWVRVWTARELPKLLAADGTPAATNARQRLEGWSPIRKAISISLNCHLNDVPSEDTLRRMAKDSALAPCPIRLTGKRPVVEDRAELLAWYPEARRKWNDLGRGGTRIETKPRKKKR